MPSRRVFLLPRFLPFAIALLGSHSSNVLAGDEASMISGTLRTWPPDPSQYSLSVDDTYYSIALPPPSSAGNEPAPAPVASSGSGGNSNNGTYTVNRGETVYAVMRATGVPVKTIIAANGLQAPYHLKAGQILKLSATGVNYGSGTSPEAYVHGDGTSHIVRPGETVYEVMRQTGVPVKQIISLNNLPAPFTIKVGQTLRLH